MPKKDATESCKDYSRGKGSLGSLGPHGVTEGKKNRENGKGILNGSHVLAIGSR